MARDERRTRVGVRWIRGAAAALVGATATLAAGCATPAEPAPASDVRITEISPEAADRIADAVADRIAARQDVPTAPRAAVVGRSAPAGGRFPPVQVSAPPKFEPAAPVPPAPAPTEADLARLKESVPLALDWFARHQSENGSWSAAGFGARCAGAARCDGPGEAHYDAAVTGLALLCFLGNGETTTTGPHADQVKRGIEFLRTAQDSEGCIGPRTSQHFMYNHAYGTLALTEAYGLTRSPTLRGSAQSAVDFVLRAQNPYLGWRYGIRDGDNDTSMTGLMVAVLRSAKLSGLTVDENAFAGALSWLDKMTEPEFGRVGYQQRGGPPARSMEAMARFPASKSESLTAIATAARVFAGRNPATDELVGKGALLLAAKPPVWNADDGSIDLYYWYWGTLAMSQKGGPEWEGWRNHLVQTLPPHQRRDDAEVRGSWDPVDPWGAEGGRVYATAVACLASEIVARSASSQR